ncbi:PREDICTED: uncharacterized protein LOC101307215 [Fragaria vesca subsp. vesca]|uniref:uncharacterized protein LOC101307215 n=1 Tax=Fragaria vesca subsp. vesca TaxID=101020 RepID=UPI0002C329D9|nr:PREDICTED: uncharacterized protein LOC101307215 [Fragaria vesca subsp. vesca]
MALTIKNKVGLVNGSNPRPTIQDNEQQQWDRCDTLVKTWLIGSMSKAIYGSVKHYKTARDIWLELQEQFCQTNTVQLFNIESAIHGCEQGTETVTAFFNMLKGLWDERDALCGLSTCGCAEGIKVNDYIKTQMMMQFLMGLNDNFALIHGSIVAIDPLPTVNKVFAMALRHEKQVEAMTGSKGAPAQPEGAAYAVRNAAHEENFEGRRKCVKCNKDTHSTKNCKAHLKCTFCGFKGHVIEDCRKRKAALEGIQAHARGNNVSSLFDKEGGSRSFLFSKAECNELFELLNKNGTVLANQAGNNSSYEELSDKAFGFRNDTKTSVWILDSGATDHMTLYHPRCWPSRGIKRVFPGDLADPGTGRMSSERGGMRLHESGRLMDSIGRQVDITVSCRWRGSYVSGPYAIGMGGRVG